MIPSLETLEDRTAPAVTYNGGLVLNNPEAVTVFAGGPWTPAQEATLRNDVATVMGPGYVGQLAPYGVSGGHVGANYTAAPTPVTSNNAVQFLVGDAILSGAVPPPDGHRFYIVFLPPGSSVPPVGIPDALGYHYDVFVGPNATPAPFAVIPLGSLSPNALTTVLSHEVVETITDPVPPTGFAGPGVQEIADVVNGQTFQVNGLTVASFVLPNGTTVGQSGNAGPSPWQQALAWLVDYWLLAELANRPA